MRKIHVLSKKYNGTLRDEYETTLYAETAETITLFSVPGLPYFDHRKGAWFSADDGLLEIYFKQRWYNVWHICEQYSQINQVYINLAMPATLQGDTLTWIDLDLDYRVHLDDSVERLDQADFDQNSHHMRYPPDLIAQVHAACREVEAGLACGAFPFDHVRQVELYQRIKHATG